MPRINYEATIRKAFNEHGRSLGTSLGKLVPSMKDSKAKCYFFLDRETRLDENISFGEHSRSGIIRHCTPVKDGYYDYIVGKEFPTLKDWSTDCGVDFSEVIYGVNHYYDGEVAYMSLTRLCMKIGPVYHPVEIPKWNCPVCLVPNQMTIAECVCCGAAKIPSTFGHSCQDGIRSILEHKGVSMDNLWVINDGTAVRWAEFVRN